MLTRTNMNESIYWFLFLQDRGGSFNKEWRGIRQTFQAPDDLATTRVDWDSVMDNGKTGSNYNYDDMTDYLKELS